MNSKPLDKTVKAQDIYPIWKKRIRDTKKSITVFSPFLNGLLVELLSANTGIAPADILVVTDFRHEALLENHPAQLHAIKALLDGGIAVRSLPLLHAKVLLTDNEHIVLGSQNFTFRGRKNKEASFVSAVTAQNSRFVKILLEWAATAEPITADRVNLLIARIDPLAKRLKKTKAEIETELDAIVAEQECEQKANHKRRLDEQVERSTIRLHCGVAFGSIRQVSSQWSEAYDTLRVESGYDLTHWETTTTTGDNDVVNLSRLQIYPLLMEDTLVMGYARIGKGVVTYVDYAISSLVQLNEDNLVCDAITSFVPLPLPTARQWSKWWWGIKRHGGTELPVAWEIPRKGNIQILLAVSSEHEADCELWISFTGYSLELISKRFTQKCLPDDQAALEKACLQSQAGLNSLFRKCLVPLTARRRSSRTKKNIREYFTDGRYRLRISEYAGVPILLARKC